MAHVPPRPRTLTRISVCVGVCYANVSKVGEAIHKSKRQNSFGLSICSRIKYLYCKHGETEERENVGGYNLLSAYTIN